MFDHEKQAADADESPATEIAEGSRTVNAQTATRKRTQAIDIDWVQKPLHLRGYVGRQVLRPAQLHVCRRFVDTNRQVRVCVCSCNVAAWRNAANNGVSELQRVSHQNPGVIQRAVHRAKTLSPALHFAQVDMQFGKTKIRRIEYCEPELHELAVLE